MKSSDDSKRLFRITEAHRYLAFPQFSIHTIRMYVRAGIIKEAEYIGNRWYIRGRHVVKWKEKGQLWFYTTMNARAKNLQEKYKARDNTDLLIKFSKNDPRRKPTAGRKKLIQERSKSYTMHEAAEVAHVTYNTICRWVRTGRLKREIGGEITAYQLRIACQSQSFRRNGG